MSNLRTPVGAVILLIMPLLLGATVPEDGEQFVCSLTETIECDADLNCGPPAPGLPPPTFIHVDLENSRITLLAPEVRRGETTQIRATESDGDGVIMSGIEAGLGWSMAMSHTDGRALVTVNLGDASLVAVGQCIAESRVTP